MILTLIAAHARGRVLGSTKGGIPWDLPRDREHFRSYCEGKTLLLGRTTYGEMAGWFQPDQTALVLSKRALFALHHPETVAFTSLADLLKHAQNLAIDELVVCGGASIYALTEPHADHAVITEIDADIAGDLTFPELSAKDWQETSCEDFPADSDHLHSMAIRTMTRRENTKHSPATS